MVSRPDKGEESSKVKHYLVTLRWIKSSNVDQDFDWICFIDGRGRPQEFVVGGKSPNFNEAFCDGSTAHTNSKFNDSTSSPLLFSPAIMNTQRASQKSCRCSCALPSSATLLFLSLLLPSSSFTQLTMPLTPQQPLIKPPSTFHTTKTSSARPNPRFLSRRQSSTYVFNYHILVAALGLSLSICIFYIARRRRRRKAALLQRHGQTALASDVAGFRRFGRSTPHRGEGRGREEREVGLDERGEAPPPYVEGGRPPSISAGITGGERSSDPAEAVELRPLGAMSGDERMTAPPDYHEHLGTEIDLARPTPAVLAEERYGSTR